MGRLTCRQKCALRPFACVATLGSGPSGEVGAPRSRLAALTTALARVPCAPVAYGCVAVAFLVPYGVHPRSKVEDVRIPDTPQLRLAPPDTLPPAFRLPVVASLKPRAGQLSARLLPRVGSPERVAPVAVMAIARPTVVRLLVAKGTGASLEGVEACAVAQRILVAHRRASAPPGPGRATMMSYTRASRRLPRGARTARPSELVPIGLKVQRKGPAKNVEGPPLEAIPGMARQERAASKTDTARVLLRNVADTLRAKTTHVRPLETTDASTRARKAAHDGQEGVVTRPRASRPSHAPARALPSPVSLTNRQRREPPSATRPVERARVGCVVPLEVPPRLGSEVRPMTPEVSGPTCPVGLVTCALPVVPNGAPKLTAVSGHISGEGAWEEELRRQ